MNNEKEIQELIKEHKERGEEITKEEAIKILDKLRMLANLMVDKFLGMSLQERKELDKKIKLHEAGLDGCKKKYQLKDGK